MPRKPFVCDSSGCRPILPIAGSAFSSARLARLVLRCIFATTHSDAPLESSGILQHHQLCCFTSLSAIDIVRCIQMHSDAFRCIQMHSDPIFSYQLLARALRPSPLPRMSNALLSFASISSSHHRRCSFLPVTGTFRCSAAQKRRRRPRTSMI